MIKSLIIIYIFFLGITGSWEGYVPGTADLYLRGNNIAKFSSSFCTFEAGQISITRAAHSITLNGTFDLVGKNNINIQYSNIRCSSGKFYITAGNGNNVVKSNILNSSSGTAQINISTAQISGPIFVKITENDSAGSYLIQGGIIFRIWLS